MGWKAMFIAAGFWGALAAPASAQDHGAATQARVVSLAVGIGVKCRAFGPIDQLAIRDLVGAAHEIGYKQVGKKLFDELARKETARRQKEIEATGARMWCTYQRANMERLGARIFLD